MFLFTHNFALQHRTDNEHISLSPGVSAVHPDLQSGCLWPENKLVLYTMKLSLGTFMLASSITILIVPLTFTNQSCTRLHACKRKNSEYTSVCVHAHNVFEASRDLSSIAYCVL